MKNKPFIVSEKIIQPGTKEILLFEAPNINMQVKINIPVHVFHGMKVGPKLFVASTVHGDEVNSIEIVRRVHKQINLKKLRGTLITIPVVNIYGLIMQSRYLPDRRDLNRSFPGSNKGTIAARLAHGVMKQVVSRCQCGIDLHTGALGRINMPQLRVNLATRGAKELALAFDTPVILDAKLRDGSLRQAASELGIPLLVYEGGEALRFNEICIRGGVRGVLNVMTHLGMLTGPKKKKNRAIISHSTRWLRAPASGLVQPLNEKLARAVKKGELLAYIHDPFLVNPSVEVFAPFDGIVIGQALKPMASEGDALYNIASFKKMAGICANIEDYRIEMMTECD